MGHGKSTHVRSRPGRSMVSYLIHRPRHVNSTAFHGVVPHSPTSPIELHCVPRYCTLVTVLVTWILWRSMVLFLTQRSYHVNSMTFHGVVPHSPTSPLELHCVPWCRTLVAVQLYLMSLIFVSTSSFYRRKPYFYTRSFCTKYWFHMTECMCS